jgi:hypothetical protein
MYGIFFLCGAAHQQGPAMPWASTTLTTRFAGGPAGKHQETSNTPVRPFPSIKPPDLTDPSTVHPYSRHAPNTPTTRSSESSPNPLRASDRKEEEGDELLRAAAPRRRPAAARCGAVSSCLRSIC